MRYTIICRGCKKEKEHHAKQLCGYCYNFKFPHLKKNLPNHKNTINRKMGKLTKTEHDAMMYLQDKKIDIDFHKLHLIGYPDFLDTSGKGYEIKRISWYNYGKKTWNIHFSVKQIANFRDEDNVLIFKPFINIPCWIFKFKDIKNLITKGGCLSLLKTRGIKEIKI